MKTVELEEVPMQIVGALDVHRRQITFRTVELASGESWRGLIRPAAREPLREWLEQFAEVEAAFVLEGTTGWRFVVEEIERAGHVARLADPAETAARRGRKQRAKTDDRDCELQLRLLLGGELPEAWIPPAHILELRTRVRLRKTLIDQRTAWLQRAAGAALPPGRAAGPEAAHRGWAARTRHARAVAGGTRGHRAVLAHARSARP